MWPSQHHPASRPPLPGARPGRGGTRRPPLPLAASIAALGLYVAYAGVIVAGRLATGRAGLDFFYNVTAARLGLQHGWAAVYDRQLYGAFTHTSGPLSYANSPAIAWLAIPFTGLPFRAGLALWLTPLLGLLLTAWWLAAPGGPWQRLGHLVAMLATAPILFGIDLGQYSLAVMGLLALHWWLVGRGRPALAGIALGLACLKPQDAFLVPVLLALTGRWRCLAGWAATIGCLAFAMALALGPAGVATYRDQLLHSSLNTVTTAYTLGSHLPRWAPALPFQAAIVSLALVPALLEGRARYGRALAAALIGSLLAAPYLNRQDLGLLVLAGWLVLATPLPRWARWAMLPSYIAVAYPGGAVGPLAAGLLWLVAIPVLAIPARTVPEAAGPPAGRRRAYGESHRMTPADRLGVWLSMRQVRRWVPSFGGRRVADVGCGYHATLGRAVLGQVDMLIALDVALDPELKRMPRVVPVEGILPAALGPLPGGWADVIMCISVLEHLRDPLATLCELHRIAAPGGLLLVNVPSWRGKWFLELSAFRLGLSPVEEIDDHKAYYDPRDLWPLLVRAGFAPRQVRCFRHKLGLNTFACCRKASGDASLA